MDRPTLLSIATIVCMLVGCGVSETVVVSGIAATNAKNQVEALNGIQFKANADVASNRVRESIALYQASTGFLPVSLQDLIDKGYLPALPALPEGLEFRYDRITGTVSTGPATAPAPTPAAPVAEGLIVQQTEFLTGLAPHIKDGRFVAPKGSNQGAAGAQQQQNRQQPTSVPQQRRSRGGGGFGGGGPMGEVMTGMGIQNELNSMSSAGSSSASSYARHGIGQKTNNYSQRQEQMLKDTGF